MSNFSYVAGADLGKNIAEALGLDANQITKMTIEMTADGPAFVIVEAFMPDDHGHLVETITRYKLVEDA